MDLKEERNMILDMVAEGRINVDEAKQLLDALEKSARASEEEDEFISTPGMDFHIPEIRMPNIPRIVNRAYRRAVPRVYSNLTDLDDIRDDLEDEMERMREELEELKEEARRIKEDAREQGEEFRQRRKEEDWED
jgi:hypothetical protein